MKLMTLDFETYYDPSIGYGMGPKGMEAEEYVRDGRFQCLGLAVAVGTGPAGWVPAPVVPEFLSKIPWHEVCAVAHNAAFDGLILHHHYGHAPAKWQCTKSMARHALVPAAGPDGKRLSYSLASLCRHFGLGEKREIAHEGYHLGNLEENPDVARELALYAKRDVELTRALWCVLARGWPSGETDVLDRVIRMTTEPVLQVEEPGPGVEYEEGDEHRANTLARVGSRGPVPANLDYHGQHTGKFSGGGGYNLPGAHKHGKARHSLRGATGHVLVSADQHALELRVLMSLARQWDVVEALSRGEDVYGDFAWDLFGKGERPDPLPSGTSLRLTLAERKVGKDVVLGCGYGMGERTLASRLTPLVSDPVRVANLAVAQYRKRFPKVPRFWRSARKTLEMLAHPGCDQSLSACGYFRMHTAEAPFPSPALELPSGRRLNYPGLRIGAGGRARYDRYGREELMTPAKLVANVVSAVSRDVVCDWMLRVCRRASYARLALVVVDELVFSCPRDRSAELASVLFEEAARPPAWFPVEVNLKAKVWQGETWGACEDVL